MRRGGAVRAIGAAALVLGASVGGVGASAELAVAVRFGRAPGGALVAALTAAALGVVLGSILAWPVVGAATLGRRWRLNRWAGIAAALVGGLAISWWLTEPLGRRLAPLYLVFCTGTAIAMALAVWLARPGGGLPAVVAASLLGAAGLAVLVAIEPETYEELQDLAFLVGVSGALAAATPLWPRLALRARAPAFAALALAGALALVPLLGNVEPGWRDATVRGAPAARALRAIVDLDRDGASPLPGGGDCDDLDGSIRPGAIDRPGGADHNCNGVDAPAALDDAARGLEPAAGDPALPSGAVDLVLLVTVDCWRADALDPRLMPAVAAFARGGMRFERLYAAGSSTAVSLPMVVGIGPRGPWIGDLARARGIAANAVMAGGVAGSLWGFPSARTTGTRADATTDAALAWIDSTPAARRFLWVHYFDLHALGPHTGKTPSGHGLDHLPVRYRVAAEHVDRSIGRLLAGLDGRGLLARTAVVMTGDHGEGVGEHGVKNHARSGYDPVLRVPGVLRAPGVPAALVSSLVSHRDLPATLLGALGLADDAAAAERFGRSWLRLRDDPARPLHRFAIARSARSVSGRELGAPLAVLIEPRYKVIGGMFDGQLELYDLTTDPDERHDLARSERDRARAMWRRLAAAWDLDYQEPPR